jgi:hypothetical protein
MNCPAVKASGIERDLDRALAQPANRAHGVVVDRHDVAREQLAVGVGGYADRADGEKRGAKHRRAPQDGIDDRAVDDGRRDEQASESMRDQPVLVRRAGERSHRPGPARGAQARSERPTGEDDEPGEGVSPSPRPSVVA